MAGAEHVRIGRIGPEHLGSIVRVQGWLRNKPGGKGRYFLWLRDGSGEIQAIAEQSALPEAVWLDCERIGIESSVIVEGVVAAHPKQEGVFELKLAGLTVVQCVGAQGEFGEYPIGKKEHGVEFLMKNRHLWLRSKRQSAILRIRNEVEKAWADFLYERGFYRVDTPIFTPNACEGTTTLFSVDYHGDTAYLAQSGQLYNEADIGALGQVYCFGPTFRAEKSKTRRHLLEFWMLEMEAAFYDFDDNLRFQEEMVAYTAGRVLSSCLSDLRDLERDPAKLEPATETPYPRVRYGEAMRFCNQWRLEMAGKAPEAASKPSLLDLADSMDELRQKADADSRRLWESVSAAGVSYEDESVEDGDQASRQLAPFCWGNDFGAKDEVAIGSHFDKPVFATNFPIEVKGFYFKDELGPGGQPAIDPVFASLPEHMKLPGMSGHTVLGADLLGSEGAGELIGGSQREDDAGRLLDKIHRHGLPEEYFQWYLDTRRFGGVPHSGFGMGLERVLCWLCGGSDTPVHIRETIAFPRMLHQFEP
jgi:asparaginyl-tRNA synthetase